MLTSNNHKEKVTVTCTEACCEALNSGKGLLSCEERRLCIAVMQNSPVSKRVYKALLSQVDVDKLIGEGYLTESQLHKPPILDSKQAVQQKKSLLQSRKTHKACQTTSRPNPELG